MQKDQQAKLTEGPIGSMLVKLTIPMIMGVLGAVLFNLVDTFFVGQLGATELAAMGFTFPVIMVVGGLSMGLGIGTSAVVARAIGKGDQKEIQRLTTDSLILAVLLVAIFIIAGLLSIEPVFRLLGATPEVITHIKSYMQIWYPGMVFMVVPMLGNNAIRATGDTKTPSIIMLLAMSVNAVLDPILIFGLGPFPRLELAGAAIATVISRAITFIVALWVLYKREKMITFAKPKLKEVLSSWKRVLYIGLPTAATNIIRPLGMGAITNLVASYGPHAVAAFGVSLRIDAFAFVVIMALSSVLGPFIGQNLGAGKFYRIQSGIKYCQRFALIWGIGMLILLAVAAKPVASIFNDDPGVISTIVIYLHLVPLGYGLFGVYALSNSAFNVLNKPINASILTIIQIFVLYIPLAYIGSYLSGLQGVFAALALTNIIIGAVAYFWLKRVLARQILTSNS